MKRMNANEGYDAGSRAGLLGRAVCAIGGAALLSGCFPAMRPSDAGNAAFVRQALPVIQGRRPQSHEEVRLLTDVIVALGDDASARAAVVRALMEDEAYVEHWDALVSDHLRVVRDGDQGYAGCYSNEPTAPEASPGALARAMRGTAAPGTSPRDPVASGYNMTDVLRSSLRADDLSVAYRAHLFAFAARPLGGAGQTEPQLRDDFTKKFLGTYVERNLACLSCHNGSWSRSGEQTGWDRTYPMPAYFEKALFGAHEGTDGSHIGAYFRSDVRGGGTPPWGLSACGSFGDATVEDGVDATFGQAGTDPRRSTVWDLDASFARGVWGLQRDGLNRRASGTCNASCLGCNASTPTPPAADLPAVRESARVLLQSRCTGGCHGAGDWASNLGDAAHWDDLLVRQPTGSPYVVPQNRGASKLWQRVTLPDGDPHRMPRAPRAPLTDPEKETLGRYIDSLGSATACTSCGTDVCDGMAREVSGDESFAYLAGAALVDNVFADVFGKKLTVVHGFSRNAHELQVHASLTNQLVYLNGGQGWSLKSTLVSLLTSKLFNRLPSQVGDGDNPYELPLLLDPWTEGDPRPIVPLPSPPPPLRVRAPWEAANAMTEGVHRHDADTLLRAASVALGWPKPQRHGGVYPASGVVDATGAFVSYAKPGSDSVSFQGLLAWEGAVGACGAQPGDWISQLMGRIEAYRAAHGVNPTYEQIVLAVKDRVISDPTIDGGVSDPDDPTDEDRPLVPGGVKSEVERTVLAQHFGVASLDVRVPGTDIEPAVRSLCGALLESPQYWLAGIAQTSLGTDPAVFDDTYEARCNDLAPRLADMGKPIVCHAGSVSAAPLASASIRERLGAICPGGVCGLVPWASDATCIKAPYKCVPEPPVCDPRCTDLACCGTETRAAPASTPGALYAWLQGGKIVEAKGVTLFRAAKQFAAETAQPGAVLDLGDWLTVVPGGLLTIASGNEKLTTRPGGVLPKTDKTKTGWALLVAGIPKLGKMDPFAEVAVPKEHVEKLLRSPALRWGEAGPRRIDPKQQAPKQSVPTKQVPVLTHGVLSKP